MEQKLIKLLKAVDWFLECEECLDWIGDGPVEIGGKNWSATVSSSIQIDQNAFEYLKLMHKKFKRGIKNREIFSE